jgi:F-type H+-transporting ATPase subunit a
MPEQLWFTALLNHLFAGPVDALLRALHIAPRYPQAPIPNSLSMELLVFGFLLVLFLIVRSRLSVDNPGGLQHLFELVDGFLKSQSNEIIGGHHNERYTPFLAALLYFILFCNLIGLIPGFESPTALAVVPLGCAICAFIYYQVQGFKHSGISYVKHFIGPSDATMPLLMRIPLAFLMLPIELVSHLARMLSLTIRLYANMFAGDMVTLVFFSLIPLGVPIAFLGLHIGVSLLQTYIFVLLTIVYLQGAVGEEH